MRYISIDCETTGLDIDNCNIIEFGAVIEDTNDLLALDKLPTFHRYLLPPEGTGRYTGEPYALSMHSEIFELIATKAEGINPLHLGSDFFNWLKEQGLVKKEGDPITVAGKNFPSFDLQFLRKLRRFSPPVRFNHRFIDPAMLYWQPLTDSRLPNMETCLERAEIEKPVLHTAVDDALLVIELIRYHM